MPQSKICSYWILLYCTKLPASSLPWSRGPKSIDISRPSYSQWRHTEASSILAILQRSICTVKNSLRWSFWVFVQNCFFCQSVNLCRHRPPMPGAPPGAPMPWPWRPPGYGPPAMPPRPPAGPERKHSRSR